MRSSWMAIQKYVTMKHYFSTLYEPVVRKTVLGVLDQHEPGSTASEDGKRLEILDIESRGIVLFM